MDGVLAIHFKNILEFRKNIKFPICRWYLFDYLFNKFFVPSIMGNHYRFHLVNVIILNLFLCEYLLGLICKKYYHKTHEVKYLKRVELLTNTNKLTSFI